MRRLSQNKNMKKTKAFTLIELLVVIAIIGILSGLIIVSMSGAQNAAKDARIKAAMDQMRSAAEVFRLNDANGRYADTAVSGGTSCTLTGNDFLYGTGGSDGQALCADIVSQGGTMTININNSTSAPKYCVQSTLNGGGSWCIDSTGGVGSTNISCDTSTLDCAAD